MIRAAAVGVALLLSQAKPVLADVGRGDAAFARGDYLGAQREWRESAEAGDASAMLGLGTLHDTGHGVPQDFAQALRWYRRAAETGDARAMFNVGAMFDNGRGTDVNRPEAVRWYVRSAARGNGRAAYAAATIYRDGDGVPRDTRAAIRFFRVAAAAGVGAARISLANLGQGVLPDAAAGLTRSPSAAAKAPEGTSSATKPAPETPSAAVGAATDKVGTPGSTMASPDAPAGATDRRSAAVASIPALPDTPRPTSVQLVEQGALAAGIERFHKLALRRADASPALSKQYETVAHEVARRATEGDDAAQYDIGFAYKQGIGMPPDLVRSYVYFVRATLSPDAELRSAALSEALDLGSRLTEAQQALATDMLTRGAQ